MLQSNLISVNELNVLLEFDPKLIILDASISPVGTMEMPKHCWPEVALPGAQFFDIEKAFSDQSSHLPHTAPGVLQFEQAAQALGVNRDSNIVVYDSFGLFSSARAWYLFKAMGHLNVAVLDGGLPAWLKQGLKTSAADPLMNRVLGNFQGHYISSYFCDADSIAMKINHSDTAILDARAHQRFLGQAPEPRVGVRSGHIPSAHSLPYNKLLDGGVLLGETELNEVFEQLSILNTQRWVMSCGSGITACILALAAKQIGHQNVCVYDGSWSEWGADLSRPVVASE